MLTIEDFIDENGNYPEMIECPKCGCIEIGQKQIGFVKSYVCEHCFFEFDENLNSIEYLDEFSENIEDL